LVRTKTEVNPINLHHFGSEIFFHRYGEPSNTWENTICINEALRFGREKGADYAHISKRKHVLAAQRQYESESFAVTIDLYVL
jgi:hypothetical protein